MVHSYKNSLSLYSSSNHSILWGLVPGRSEKHGASLLLYRFFLMGFWFLLPLDCSEGSLLPCVPSFLGLGRTVHCDSQDVRTKVPDCEAACSGLLNSWPDLDATPVCPDLLSLAHHPIYLLSALQPSHLCLSPCAAFRTDHPAPSRL